MLKAMPHEQCPYSGINPLHEYSAMSCRRKQPVVASLAAYYLLSNKRRKEKSSILRLSYTLPRDGHQLPLPSGTSGCFTCRCVVNGLTSLKLSILPNSFSSERYAAEGWYSGISCLNVVSYLRTMRRTAP